MLYCIIDICFTVIATAIAPDCVCVCDPNCSYTLMLLIFTFRGSCFTSHHITAGVCSHLHTGNVDRSRCTFAYLHLHTADWTINIPPPVKKTGTNINGCIYWCNFIYCVAICIPLPASCRHYQYPVFDLFDALFFFAPPRLQRCNFPAGIIKVSSHPFLHKPVLHPHPHPFFLITCWLSITKHVIANVP